MIDQSFSSTSGLKVRTIEAEAAGGLVEIDLRELKPTADGTYLLPSKDLQAAGKWALTLDVAHAKKEGKKVSPEDEKNADSTLLFLNSLMDKLPKVLQVVTDIKNARPHPMQIGIENAVSQEVCEMARTILNENAGLRERLEEMVEEYLERNIFGPEQDEEDKEEEEEGSGT